MTRSMTKTLTATLAALTLVTAISATSSESQARPRHGAVLGFGIVAGTLLGAAIASNAYAGPRYVEERGYRECRYVKRYNRWGHRRVVKICDYAPY